MMAKHAALALGTAILLALASGPRVDDYAVDWCTVDGGGEMWSTGGAYELSGTIGQPDASPIAMTGGSYELTGGFWPGAAAEAPLPGDCDGDGDVDLDDLADFEPCLRGPGGGLAHGCDCFDFDANSDVDLFDFAEFLEVFTGS